MKRSQLIKLIKEEISNILEERSVDRKKWEMNFELSIWDELKKIHNLEDSEEEATKKVYVDAAIAAYPRAAEEFNKFDPRFDAKVKLLATKAVKKHIDSSRTSAQATVPTKVDFSSKTWRPVYIAGAPNGAEYATERVPMANRGLGFLVAIKTKDGRSATARRPASTESMAMTFALKAFNEKYGQK